MLEWFIYGLATFSACVVIILARCWHGFDMVLLGASPIMTDRQTPPSTRRRCPHPQTNAIRRDSTQTDTIQAPFDANLHTCKRREASIKVYVTFRSWVCVETFWYGQIERKGGIFATAHFDDQYAFWYQRWPNIMHMGPRSQHALFDRQLGVEHDCWPNKTHKGHARTTPFWIFSLTEMTWTDVMRTEVKRNEVNWGDVNWSGVNWSELKRSELKWCELK